MGKFISNFDTTAELATFSATTDFGKPHVSLTKDNSKVHFFEYDPYNGHAYVEIGGLKWATMNIGASQPSDYGLYFQWGDTQGYTTSQVGSGEGQKYFGWEDYKYGNGTSEPGDSGMTKYNSTDGKTVLDLEDDAARANWGGSWRMPTNDEYVALGNAVNTGWTDDYQGSGVAGMICTDKTDSSKTLFFPVANTCANGSLYGAGDSAQYRSSTSSGTYSWQRTQVMSFNTHTAGWDGVGGVRHYGQPVRGVIG